MFKRFARSLQFSLALMIALFSNGLLTTATAYAAQPAGNNGDIKVTNEDFPDGIPENNPQLTTCSLYVDFYNYDQDTNSYADVSFDMQAPTDSDIVTVTGDQHPFIGEDAAGGNNDLDAHVPYTLSFTGAPAAQGYHVKLTVDAPGSKGADVKHKVFWMPASCQQSVTATAPSAVDLCGVASDTYTIPQVDHVQYFTQINGTLTPVDPGTYTATSTSVVIVARATDGYVLTGDSQWVLTFSDVPCTTTVHTKKPHLLPPTCDNQYYTLELKHHAGYHYEVNGVKVHDGDQFPADGSTITIVAVPNDGYTLTGKTSWTFTLTPANGCGGVSIPVTPQAPTFSDICGIEGDTYTIPSTTGVNYYVNGTLTAAGTYNIDADNLGVNITAQAQDGYMLEGATSWAYTFTNENCPPEKTPAHITYATVCTANGVLVTLTNDGQTDGTAYVNGQQVLVAAGGTAKVTVPVDSLTFQANFDILINDHTYHVSLSCAPGMGSTTPTPPAMPTELPSTGGEGASPLMLVMLMATVYGVSYFLQGKRREFVLGRLQQ